ncbi:MAG: F0F1 ATP synthase subunit delta [Verrucomicrobiota bacterium]
MKVSKEIRQNSRDLLRASLTKGAVDRGKVASLMQSVIASKPRNYIQVLESYKRLLRLEVQKRHATIESATELNFGTRDQILSRLKNKYGTGLTTEFVVNGTLLGGVRIRVGSDVWDSSVRNRLQRLQQKL